MTYKDGTWGEKAKERSKKRTQYFVEYKRKNRKASTFVPKGCPKKNARQRVRDHVLSGKIHKPLKCEHCSKENKLEAHHKDYSKPLEVEWLCKECHVIADKKLCQK